MSNNLNPSYINQRPDIEKLLPAKPRKVLDIGCSIGTLGASIKEKTGAEVFGIEYSETMAATAKENLDKVYVGDAQKIIAEGELEDNLFDTIIFADILEHLVDPWSVINNITKYLDKDGVIIASIPNARHLYTIYNLMIKGYWPYNDRGLHDRTHLRFFTLKNISELFNNANLTVETINTNYRIYERPHRINRIAKYMAVPGLKNFIAYQYLIRAYKPNN